MKNHLVRNGIIWVGLVYNMVKRKREDIMQPEAIYLRPTPIIDCDNAAVKEKARELVKEQPEVPDKARSLFYFVRDGIKYNVYVPGDRPEHYRASRTLEMGEGFCIHKAVLLAALARAVGIPARLHLAAIRNHLVPAKLERLMGGNLFPAHGYADLYLEGKWVKVAPTFNLKLCQRNRFVPTEFDGGHDAVLPTHNLDGKPHIEYVTDRGYYADLPFEEMHNWRREALGDDFFERMRQAIKSRKARP
jgi:transglutaminase-like putative cysteine protease